MYFYTSKKGGEIMNEQFYNTAYEEQETIINIDYAGSKVFVYISRRGIYEKIKKKIGKPTKKHITQNKISGATWEIPFEEKKKISTVLSRPLLIGNIK